MDFQYNLCVQIYWGMQWGLQYPVSCSGCHMCSDIMGCDCMTPFLPSQGGCVSGILLSECLDQLMFKSTGTRHYVSCKQLQKEKYSVSCLLD